MSDRGGEALDVRLTLALERKPQFDLPAGFAARVAGQLPARPAVAVTGGRYGFAAMRIAMALLVLALVGISVHSAGHSKIGVALEWILCAELVAFALWQGDFSALRKS